ncbi:MAG: hypothetical protein KF687_13590 [Cyclobacteriaceae bacterium]|nr:hypothetical protein [Cyclobacteriaceae bacterium]
MSINLAHPFRALILFIVFNGCSSVKKQNVEQMDNVVMELAGENFSWEFSPSKNYILCVEQPLNESIKQAVKFIVVDAHTNKIIYENSFLPGSVKWLTDTTLEVYSIPGTLEKNDDLSNYKKIINIEQQKY